MGIEDVGVEIDAPEPFGLTLDDVFGENARLVEQVVAALRGGAED